MEVPVINNLNDNGDRQRPKGKDAFKDQQKESEVNAGGCMREVCVAGELSDQLNVPPPCGVLAQKHAGRRRGAILAAESLKIVRLSYSGAGGEM